MNVEKFVDQLETMADTFGRPLIGKAAMGYWSALWGLREEAFQFACHRTITMGDRMPTPGQLLKTAQEWPGQPQRAAIRNAVPFKQDPRKDRLDRLEQRRNRIAESPYSKTASRDLENIDAEIEAIWDEIQAEVNDQAKRRDGTP